MATLSEYRAKLRTNKHRLDDELEVQADTQDRIAQEVNRLQSKFDKAEDEYRRTQARLTEDVQRDAVERGTKMTVDMVTSAVRRHRDRQTAWSAREAAASELREWQALLEAWKVKGFTLRDLGALYGADYFSLTQVSLSGTSRRDLDASIDAAARQALRGASQDAAPARRRVIINA